MEGLPTMTHDGYNPSGGSNLTCSGDVPPDCDTTNGADGAADQCSDAICDGRTLNIPVLPPQFLAQSLM